jgi:hypothetical protein
MAQPRDPRQECAAWNGREGQTIFDHEHIRGRGFCHIAHCTGQRRSAEPFGFRLYQLALPQTFSPPDSTSLLQDFERETYSGGAEWPFISWRGPSEGGGSASGVLQHSYAVSYPGVEQILAKRWGVTVDYVTLKLGG